MKQVTNKFCFMSFGESHHDLAPQEIGNALATAKEHLGLFHIVFEVPLSNLLRTFLGKFLPHHFGNRAYGFT